LFRNVNVADSGVATDGVKTTVTTQAPPGATEPSVGQVLLVTAKSAAFVPLMAGEALKVSGALPVFVTVTDIGALGMPTGTTPKRMLLAESEATGAGAAAPVPLRDTISGPPGRLLPLMFNVALRAPTAVGVNVITMEQLAPPATCPAPVGHVDAPVIAKSPEFAPVMLIEVSCSVPVPPVTLMVTVCGALVVVTA